MAKDPRKRDLWDLATGRHFEVFSIDLREIVKVNPGRYSTTEPTQAQFDEFRRNNPNWEEAEKPAEPPKPLPVRDSPMVALDKRIAYAEAELEKAPDDPARKSKLASLLYERGGDGDAEHAKGLLASLTAEPNPAAEEGKAAEDAAVRQEAIVAALRKLDPSRDFKDGKIADMRKLKARLNFNPSEEEIEAGLRALTGEAAE